MSRDVEACARYTAPMVSLSDIPPVPNRAYEDKYVLFLDMLGFQALVDRTRGDEAARRTVHGIVDLFRTTLCPNPTIDLRFTQFSDCIVASAAPTREGLWELVRCIDTLMCNMLQHDILCRGGLSRGEIVHDDAFVYGPAMNAAYRLESRDADVPIVLLEPRVAEEFVELGPDFLQWMESDGIWPNGSPRFFVDYLLTYRVYDGVPRAGQVEYRMSADRIRFLMSRRLSVPATDVRVRDKEIWFQHYWNRMIQIRKILGDITDETFELGAHVRPTIIKRMMLASR